MAEIRWMNGKESYDREEIKYMLETQRAMIYNDVKLLAITQAENLGIKGALTEHGRQIMQEIENCRKVEF